MIVTPACGRLPPPSFPPPACTPGLVPSASLFPLTLAFEPPGPAGSLLNLPALKEANRRHLHTSPTVLGPGGEKTTEPGAGSPKHKWSPTLGTQGPCHTFRDRSPSYFMLEVTLPNSEPPPLFSLGLGSHQESPGHEMQTPTMALPLSCLRAGTALPPLPPCKASMPTRATPCAPLSAWGPGSPDGASLTHFSTFPSGFLSSRLSSRYRLTFPPPLYEREAYSGGEHSICLDTASRPRAWGSR